MSSLPNGWRQARIGDVCKVVSGSTPRRSHPEFWGGDIDWVTPKDLTGLSTPVLAAAPERITKAGYDSCSATLLPKGAVLFSSRAPIGLVAIAGKPMCTNQGFKSLVPSEDLDSGYLFWCMRYLTPKIQAQGTGTTFSEVSKRVMERITLPLPPLDEQRRIAAILDKADAIRRKRREAIALTEELLRSTFLEMFGDPVTNPKGWPVRTVGQLFDVQGGLQVSKKRASSPIDVPYLRVANVYRNKLKLDEIKLMRVTERELERVRLEEGDILFVEGHGNPEEVGRTAVWDGSIEKCVHQNHLIRARALSDRVEPVYANAFLNSTGGRRQLQRFGKTTSGLNTISTRQVRSTKVLLPPLANQRAFVRCVDGVRRVQRQLVEGQSEADDLFHSLVQRAFRGEL